jgi:Outer membrane lipoprotein-sorting protein
MNVRLRKHDPCNGRAALLRGFDIWRRGSAALPLLAAMNLLAGGGGAATTTNDLSDAEIQGRQLAQQLLEQGPGTNFVQNGVLNIRAGKGKHSEIPLRFQTTVNGTGWQTIYETTFQSNRVRLIVIHKAGRPNEYFLREGLEVLNKEEDGKSTALVDSKLMTPFAGSDFWVADLGLEFFHWPQQKILKHAMTRGRACKVLKSTNPSPSTNGYSSVVSWIDNESGGIVHAEACDANGKLLKEFDPKSFKKVNGQWELQEMEIRNDQTGSRTRLEFDLKKE